MNLIKTFRIIIGVLLLISTITIFALIFLEIESLVIFFDFSIDYTAENLGEAIVGAIAGMMAGLMFMLAMLIVAIFNAIVYTTVGVLTITLKRNKVMPIIIVVLTSFVLFLEIRVLIILSLVEMTSIIFPLRIISDIIIIALSITSFVLILKAKEKTPRD
jgi:hypothetical protein